MPPTSPVVAAWELGLRLKDARELAGMKGVTAAKALGLSQNFLSDVEHGRRKLKEDKLSATQETYGIPEAEMNELLVLRERTGEHAWWAEFSDLFHAEVLRYFGLEHGAESVRTHESTMIPGLLQTDSYARAIVTSDSPNTRTSEASRRIRARMLRQGRLTDDEPLGLTAVVGEAALRQRVGGSDIFSEQLRHLLELLDKLPDSLDFRVMPFDAGAHGALGASTFHLLGFAEPKLPDLGWQETVTTWALIENPVRVGQYSETYAEALVRAADRQQSFDLVRRAFKDIT